MYLLFSDPASTKQIGSPWQGRCVGRHGWENEHLISNGTHFDSSRCGGRLALLLGL